MAKQKFTMPDGEVVEKDMPQWKTPWNHDTDFESARTSTYCKDESLTKQEFKEETDINVILERFTRTKEPPPMALPEHFTDLTGRTTYFDMATKVAEAQSMFYELPAKKRAEFQNDPDRWADAVVQAVDAGDGDLLRELGCTLELRPDADQPELREANEAYKRSLRPTEPGTPPGGTPPPGNPAGASDAPKSA